MFFTRITGSLTFTPAEVERITLVSPEVQRVWRARGHIPRSASPQATFDVQAAAMLMIRRALSSVRLPANLTTKLCYLGAPHVYRWALTDHPGAYHVTTIAGAEVPDDVMAEAKGFIDQALGLDLGPPRRFLAQRDDAEPVLCAELDALFAEASFGCFVDLRTLGLLLATRAGGPLLEVAIGRIGPVDGKSS